ncbi:hypothetical protein SAMN04488515_0618 [Cognatiyoonia koreensis]|uniref:Uncharacterized protein n=1 Tax=Cognatiyoonia koreensis TaxID=364200 RepID=A0A1I0NGW4_9RHOB|nr:transferrin-binding protein-like solute binding protein [Cognatiyoonia koreensis]SEW00707.1 hypothetical protein SAMN04488515_0618 [Cognatiyoonia koreensis]
MNKFYALFAIGFAAGCSGGGDPDKVYVALDGTGETPVASTVAGASASFDRDTNTLTFNGEEGQINAAGDSVTFPSGATMSLSGLDNEYSRLFVLSGAESAFGAYGVSTDRRDIPSGSASYSGSSIVVVTAPEGVFDLTGDASVDVSFASGRADLTLDELSGTQATGLSAPDAVDDFGSIEISDIDLDGNRLRGGEATVDTDETDAFSAGAPGGVRGTLFGPDADEVGGSLEITGDAAAINGGFIAFQ